MLRCFVSFCLLAVSAQSGFAGASDPILFTDALAQGKILVTVKGLGGHSGRCVAVHFERLTSGPLELKIPAGHVFEATDSTIQNLVVVKEEVFTLSGQKQFIRVQGLCSEPGDGNPGEQEAYTLGRSAQGPLLKMAEHLSQKKLWANGDAQMAIWAMVDSSYVTGITHPGLLAAACQILARPEPQYTTKFARPAARPNAAPVRRAPVVEKKPMSVEGKFKYQSNTATTISVYVQNAAGERVKTIFEHQEHPPGVGEYSFFFQTTRLPAGKYEVVLYAGDRPVQKIKVDY